MAETAPPVNAAKPGNRRARQAVLESVVDAYLGRSDVPAAGASDILKFLNASLRLVGTGRTGTGALDE
jgi:hypothetical protein